MSSSPLGRRWRSPASETSLSSSSVFTSICRDPLTRPSQDWYDLQPHDGAVTAVCQYDGTFSVRATQLAPCVTVCDQYNIPTPDMVAGLQFMGIKRKTTGRLEKVEKMIPEAFIWAEDALVYQCKEPQYGIRGGVDRVLDMYTCLAATGQYSAPRGLNTHREDEQEPWPVCQPQIYSEYSVQSSTHFISDSDNRLFLFQ